MPRQTLVPLPGNAPPSVSGYMRRASVDYMTGVTGTLVFSTLILLSLVVVSFVNRIQTRARLIRQKCFQIQRRIDELEETSSAIEPLLESVAIPRLINEELLDLIRSLEQLDPKAASIEVKRANAQEASKSLAAGQRTQPLYRVQSSDSAIARNKYYLTEAARVVRRHKAIGRLENAELDAYIRELSWAHLMVEAVTHISQGHRAVNRNEPMAAYAFYRKAQNLLMSANHPDARRHRFIKEITEMLAGERLSISIDLMPEDEFNPTAKPDFANSQADLAELKRLAGDE